MIELLILIICAVGSLVAMGLIATWAIGPVNCARTQIGAPTRFMITDIFWLMVLLQEGLAFVTQFVPREEPEAFKLILGFLVFAAIALWAGGVSFSSQAGVRRLVDRSLVILVLLPGTLLVMIGIPATTILTLTAIHQENTDWSKPYNGYYIAWVCLICGALLLRVLSSWLAHRIFAQLPKKNPPSNFRDLPAGSGSVTA